MTTTAAKQTISKEDREYLNRLPRHLRKGALERKAKQDRLNADRSRAQDKLRT